MRAGFLRALSLLYIRLTWSNPLFFCFPQETKGKTYRPINYKLLGHVSHHAFQGSKRKTWFCEEMLAKRSLLRTLWSTLMISDMLTPFGSKAELHVSCVQALIWLLFCKEGSMVRFDGWQLAHFAVGFRGKAVHQFLKGRIFFLFTLCVFVTGQSILVHHDGSESDVENVAARLALH